MSLPNSQYWKQNMAQDNSLGCEPINFPSHRKSHAVVVSVALATASECFPREPKHHHRSQQLGTVSTFFFIFSRDRIFLCSLGYPWTHSDSPTSASGVVRLWPCTTILGLMWCWDKIRALCILGKLSINWDTSQSWREHILFQLILLMIIIYEVGIILLLIYQW